MENQVKAIKNQVLEHLRQENMEGLTTLAELTHPADLALVLVEIDYKKARRVFETMPAFLKSRVLEKLPSRFAARFISEYPDKKIISLVEGMAPEQAGSIFLTFPAAERDNLMGLIDDDDFRRKLIDIISYLPGCAGGRMQTRYLAVDENKSVEETLDIVNDAPEGCFVHYIYTVDEERCLRGVVSLRRLVKSAPGTRLRDLALSDPYRVRVDDQAAEAMKLMRRYNLPALPVVDHQGRPRGLFTAGAAARVQKEENILDLSAVAGLTCHGSAEADWKQFSPDVEIWTNLGIRLPWLVAVFFGCLLAGVPLALYRDSFFQHPEFFWFIPLLLILPTVIAVQSAISYTRNLTLSPVGLSGFRTSFFGEIFKTGLPAGLFFAFFSWLVPWTWRVYRDLDNFRGLPPGVTAGLAGSIFLAAVMAAGIGIIIPVIFRRLNLRPALAAPFLLAFQPAVNLAIYILVILNLPAWF